MLRCCDRIACSPVVSPKLKVSTQHSPMIPGTHARLKDELIVVIGGGIGGLATALALQLEGARVEVYERDTDFEDRKQGYGLTLTHNETGPLAKLGVLDVVRMHDATASPSARHFIFDMRGTLLGFYGNDFTVHSPEDSDGKLGQLGPSENTTSNSTVTYQRGNLRIPRQELRRVLLERLQPGTVHWGKKLETLEPIASSCDKVNASGKDGNKSDSKGEPEACAAVRVRFTDGSEAEPASLVVASDGIRSIARSCVDGPGMAGPSYTGIFIVLGLSPADHPLIRGGGFYTYDGEVIWGFYLKLLSLAPSQMCAACSLPYLNDHLWHYPFTIRVRFFIHLCYSRCLSTLYDALQRRSLANHVAVEFPVARPRGGSSFGECWRRGHHRGGAEANCSVARTRGGAGVCERSCGCMGYSSVRPCA